MDNDIVNPSSPSTRAQEAQEAMAAALDELKKRVEDFELRTTEIERSVVLMPGGSPTELPP